MNAGDRIERALSVALESATSQGCPPRLAAAVRYAVFPGGARIRPRLGLAVSRACGDDRPRCSDAAAAAIELLHCASLVHDDLPCFDDAPVRRGKPSVHVMFGERLAVLAGDALIVESFREIVRGALCAPERMGAMIEAVGAGVGMPDGIVAGQAWECEPRVSLADYQRAKTGALFAAATMAGAVAAGFRDAAAWRPLGERLGEAFQVADDILDVAGDPDEIGKPIGRDATLGRPSAARELGLSGALARLRQLVAGAVESIPDCPGVVELRAQILREASGLLPEAVVRRAA